MSNFIREKALDAVGTTGAGNPIVPGWPLAVHTIQVDFTDLTGTLSALVVDLEGSLTGGNFSTLGTLTFDATDISNGYAMMHVVSKGVMQVKANITTLTTTGTTSVTVSYLGMDS